MKNLSGIDFIYQNNDDHQTIIGYKGKLYVSCWTVNEILMILCESYGRDVNGSKAVFAKITHGHQKLGVLVDPQKEELYFPTHAASNDACIWINYGRIFTVGEAKNGCCKIVFKSGHELMLSCSSKVVKRQMKRCRIVLESLGNPYERIIVSPVEG